MKQEFARELYCMLPGIITISGFCKSFGLHQKTVQTWVEEGNWDLLRAQRIQQMQERVPRELVHDLIALTRKQLSELTTAHAQGAGQGLTPYDRLAMLNCNKAITDLLERQYALLPKGCTFTPR